MRKYRRMNWTDRLHIEALYNAGHTYRFIAEQTGFTVAAVYREVQRGLYDHFSGAHFLYTKRYSAQIAHEDAAYQSTGKGVPIKLGCNHEYARHVSARILAGDSPAIIVNTLRRKGEWTVSTPTLYRYIEQGYIPGVTAKNLRERPSRKKKYEKVQKAAKYPQGFSIERRPSEINGRTTFGHWEMDSIIGKKKGNRQSFLALTERKTRFEILVRVPDKTSASTVHALDTIIPKFPKGTFKTITVDNGSEFKDCYGMEHAKDGSKRLTVYYCHPYTSCERGSNERANRILRRYFPKGQSLNKYTQKDCDKAARALNDMPRKILNWQTAAELFEQELQALEKIF